MEIKKRDYLLLLLVIVIMTVTSCMVEDSRAMTPPKEPIVEKAVKKVITKIEDAHYITKGTTEEISLVEEEALVQSVEEVVVEEIIVEEELITSHDSEPFSYEYEEDYFEEEVIDEYEYYEESQIEESYEPGLSYLGTYEITAYEWTGNPCANGCYPTEGYTVACNDLPLGTEVYIEGVGYRVVEDTGGGGSGWMDLYLGDVSSCYAWGRQYREVYLVG